MPSFTLLVTSSAFDSQSSHTAYEFCRAALGKNHQIHSVFFYQKGVMNSNAFLTNHSDELNLHELWRSLALENTLTLNVCVTAANRRGIITEQDAEDLDIDSFNLKAPFESVGLGELISSLNASDRLVQF
jgi:tRNA 2-thiouridine synthesizing protein D